MKTRITRGRLTEVAHRVAAACVRPGDTVVDATAGNGNDSVFLAGLVGGEGRVYCFDLQEAACRETERRLDEVGAHTEVHCCGHEEMARRVGSGVRAVMFNLGYLPGSNHEVITRPESTLAGVEAALSLLGSGGLVTILCYVGHPGGAEEAEAVTSFCDRLDEGEFVVTRCDTEAASEGAPFLVVIERVDNRATDV